VDYSPETDRMAPTNAWNATGQNNTTKSENGFPQLKPQAVKVPKSQYEEIQEDELIVLASMYGDEFQDTTAKDGAWKKSEPSFSICIKSSDAEVAVTLQVVLTATYPRSVPLLTLKDDEDLQDGTRFKIQKLLETKPKELLAMEQAMVMEIVEAIREILDDAARAKAEGLELPSLEEERAMHEAEASKLAQEQKEEEERKRQQESIEEERMLGHMLEDELKRQRVKAKEAKRKSKPPTLHPELSQDIDGDDLHERLVFEQSITLSDINGDSLTFLAVTGRFMIRRGPVSDCFTVRPVVARGASQAPTLVLKEAELSSTSTEQAQFKKSMQALEADLEALKKNSTSQYSQIARFSSRQKDRRRHRWPVDSQHFDRVCRKRFIRGVT